jgi:hypothetical protein
MQRGNVATNRQYRRPDPIAVVMYSDAPTIYYHSFDFTTTLHEALHISENMTDAELHEKLVGYRTENPAASEGISRALREHGCR